MDGSTDQSSSVIPAPAPTSTTTTAVFRPLEHTTPPADLQDSDFELSPAEIQAAFREVTDKAAQRIVLRTGAMRARDEALGSKAKPVWSKTKIRIKFSDRTQIERIFPSESAIGVLYDFVRNSLSDEHRSQRFTLLQPPRTPIPETPPPPPSANAPKRVRPSVPPAPVKVTLADHALAPSSVLLVSFENPELNRSDRPAPLLPSLLSIATDLPKPAPPSEPSPVPAPGSGSADRTGLKPAGGDKARGSGKIPKWFKSGKK
ncbi:UBX [Phaffia rhodozyma]|uniref:UBX n=1 Tax=Phaffia rhodozyma TaxID=264483 RepID=A0A0F7SPG6_PHARH|nr:UBX [Phaffia rhodozyma]